MPAWNALTMDQILDRLYLDGDCLTYSGCLSNGYGKVGYKGKSHRVHRLLYEEFVGPVPAGLDLDHICRNRACANVEHLEPVTRAENLNRGISLNRMKTHCPEGHPLSGDNLKLEAGNRRRCVTCNRKYKRLWEAAKSARLKETDGDAG